jgi:Mn-dependent DtxR family transcriptional regulator
MTDQKAQVLDVMKKKGKPVRPGDVAKDLGIESKEVSKMIQELKKDGKVHSPRNCFWEPTG